MEHGRDRGLVVWLEVAGQRAMAAHERITQMDLARRLADLRGDDYLEVYEPDAVPARRLYFVPCDTLLADEARALGIQSTHDLYGGVVPHPFVATKTITHPLVDNAAVAPHGWSACFAERVAGVVLPGFSAFSLADARRAGSRLLAHGAARVKLADGIGGNGQTVVADRTALDAALAAVAPAAIGRSGLSIEQNLREVVTHSVGQVHVADWRVSYHGTQRQTANQRGTPVYGGSALTVVRGDFAALLALDLAPEVRIAVEQARRYDAAATREFPDLFASRRNYDIAQGFDDGGVRRSGVLEQSWRIGGASPAEIAALGAFRDDPTLRIVRVSAVEVYADAGVPPRATVHYRAAGARVGPVLKYSLVEPWS